VLLIERHDLFGKMRRRKDSNASENERQDNSWPSGLAPSGFPFDRTFLVNGDAFGVGMSLASHSWSHDLENLVTGTVMAQVEHVWIRLQ
jgi:hypothetical protein